MNQTSLHIFLNLQVWSRVFKPFLDLFLTFHLPFFTIHSLPIQLHCPLTYTRYPAKAQFKPEPITSVWNHRDIYIKLLPHWVVFYPYVLIFLLPIFFHFFVSVHIFCCLLLDCTSFKPLPLIWLTMSHRHRSLMSTGLWWTKLVHFPESSSLEQVVNTPLRAEEQRKKKGRRKENHKIWEFRK